MSAFRPLYGHAAGGQAHFMIHEAKQNKTLLKDQQQGKEKPPEKEKAVEASSPSSAAAAAKKLKVDQDLAEEKKQLAYIGDQLKQFIGRQIDMPSNEGFTIWKHQFTRFCELANQFSARNTMLNSVIYCSSTTGGPFTAFYWTTSDLQVREKWLAKELEKFYGQQYLYIEIPVLFEDERKDLLQDHYDKYYHTSHYAPLRPGRSKALAFVPLSDALIDDLGWSDASKWQVFLETLHLKQLAVFKHQIADLFAIPNL